MLIAGIDEAGLGPALGVLCVAGTVIRVPDRAEVGQRNSTGGGLNCGGAALPDDDFFAFGDPHKFSLIADSKKIFPARGIRGLEIPLLAAWRSWRGALPESRDQFFDALGDQIFREKCREIPWYRGNRWQFADFAADAEIRDVTERARKSPLKIVALRSRTLTAAELNRRFAHANKSAVAWKLVAELIADFVQIAREAREEKIIITVDKQGGRHFYAPLLAEIFDSAIIAASRESPEWSEYRAPNATVIFTPRADKNCLPVALASMLAKYIREKCMRDLNAWFAAALPEIRPTAGYHGDAPRFYAAVKDLLVQEKIPVEHFWRSR